MSTKTWELPGHTYVTQQQLVAFINDLVERKKQYEGPERRGGKRELLITEVRVFPLDLSLKRVGEGFTAISRDISTSGISFFNDEPTTPFLAVELEDGHRKICAAMEVVRCEAKGPLFEIAGKFIYKIYKQDP